MKFGINFFPSFRPEDSTTADYYAQCLRLAERADELGYNSVKTVEHSFFDYGDHSPNPCVFLSAIAARTKRIRLVTGAVIPAFHHPAHLGGDLAMLDNMSNGRLDAASAAPSCRRSSRSTGCRWRRAGRASRRRSA